MFKLIIKKQDGSLYWTEHFNTLDDADKWLDEEMTRPYWDATLTSEIIDMTPSPPTQEELTQQATNLAARAYLASTDWMVVRALEDPTKPVPTEIATARQVARDSIV
jgi:hypothetical protein